MTPPADTTLEFAYSRTRHSRLGEAPLCGARSKWKATPSSKGPVTCLRCLAVLSRRAKAAGNDLYECGVCGLHVGVTTERKLVGHRQPNSWKQWCYGFNTDASTLRRIATPTNRD